MQPKKPVRHTVSILTRRKRMWFSHLCNVVMSNPTGTKSAAEMPTIYTPYLKKIDPANSRHEQPKVKFILFDFFSSFYTLANLAIKRESILRSSWNLEHIKGLLSASLYQFWLESDKDLQSYDWFFALKKLKICHAYRLNCWLKLGM